MIQPAKIAFQGVVGGTFDTQITLFDGNLQYVWFGVWQPFRTYPINAMVAGADSNVYVSLNAIAMNDNPVGDSTNWSILAKLNLTGWTGTCTIGGGLLTGPTTMGGALGTIAINFSGTQTGTLTAGTEYDLNIEVIDPSSNNYFPVIGTITFVGT